MNCPKCGKILEPGAVICPNCGETVVENIADDNGSSLKRSVVSEDVLRNFSDPEHISDEDNQVIYSNSLPDSNSESPDDENQFFNPDDYKNEDDYQSSYSAFDDDMENDGQSDVSHDEDEREKLFEDDYSPRAVEDYDIFSDDDDDTYDDDDDEDEDDDDDDDDDYDSVIVENNFQDNAGAKRTRIVLIAILILAMLVVICGVVYLVFGEKLGLVSDTSESHPSTFETGNSQSSEAFMFQIPDLYKMKYSEAVTRAKEYGLETKIVYENSETVEKGLVMKQSPSAGTTGKVGDTITITVSLGKDGEATSDATTETSTTNPTENTTSSGGNSSTTEPTERPTQKPTQPTTEKPTEPPTTQPPTTEEPTEKPTEPSEPENNYYILPDSASRLLTTSDISDLSMSELELARNEIYARHGRRFDTDYIQEYFNSQKWYSGTIDPDDFDYGVLSDIEVANVWFIYNYEHSN